MTKIVTFGETMLQYNALYVGPLNHNGAYLEDCAGAESNFAVNLVRLGNPYIQPTWISQLGDDSAADFILGKLAGKTKLFAPKIPGEKTGVSYLNHQKDGTPIKMYRREGSAASKLPFTDVSPHLKDSDLIHVTGITPALSDICRNTVLKTLQYATKTGIPVSFDLNYREQLWSPSIAKQVYHDMIEHSTIFKFGYDEVESIWRKGWSPERYARHFQKYNRNLVIVTTGEKGSFAYDGESMIYSEGFKIDMVDPVGAGDAFMAGLFGGILKFTGLQDFLHMKTSDKRKILESALEIANVCGAMMCTQHGDTSSMPTMKQVEDFLGD